VVALAQFGGPRYDPDSVSALVDRVHVDLDHAYAAWHFSNGDRKRLNDAEKQLRDFARKWRRNHFDKGELDEAISSIQHVLDNNHLTGQARDALSDDVNQMRQMREAYDRHEIGGAR
jgi:hypothetical protein